MYRQDTANFEMNSFCKKTVVGKPMSNQVTEVYQPNIGWGKGNFGNHGKCAPTAFLSGRKSEGVQMLLALVPCECDKHMKRIQKRLARNE